MKVLLDTHIFLWAVLDPDKLPHFLRELIEDGTRA
jgi:PIN domain nuclease of toxin-antitoxin system